MTDLDVDEGAPWASVTSTKPAGGWTGADPRYRGYRPAGREVRLDHRVRLAIDLVPPTAGGRLIDLGAGDGFVTAELGAKAGAALAVAVDVGFPEPLAPRRRRVSRVSAFVPGPLPFKAGSFDVVVSLECIEHLLDPDALLEEAKRLLKPGGRLVLSTPRLDALLVVISLLGGVQPPGVESSSRRRYGNPFGEQRPSGHVHLFTRKAMTEALAANGLRLEAYREARFSSSWWQAVRASRRPRPRDWAVGAVLAAYDLIPFKKDVMVLRAAP
ncbi:MAG: class I SAM-dependent methyltransferase [Acidimicrobiia bacterium]